MAELNYGILFYYRLLAQSGYFVDDLFAPEDAGGKPRVAVQEDLCIGCGGCEAICPSSAIRLWDEIAHVANPAACEICLSALCIGACPTDAVAMLNTAA